MIYLSTDMIIQCSEVCQKHFGAKLFHAAVLQAHAVEHARGGLHHAGIGVALAVGARGAFHHEASQTVEIDEVGELFAIPEGAAGGHHGILQLEIMYFNV